MHQSIRRFFAPLLLAPVLLAGCGKPAQLLNASPLMPLVQARYKADNSVKTFQSAFKPGDPVYYQGRALYDRAAGDVNALLTIMVLSIESNSSVAENEVFEEQVATSLKSAINFQNFVEAKTVGGSRGKPGGISIAEILTPIDPNTLVPALIQGINQAADAARAADSQQRAIMVCELKSLLLPSFDAIELETATYPDPSCAALRVKLTPKPKAE